jgi:hypothetical protein
MKGRELSTDHTLNFIHWDKSEFEVVFGRERKMEGQRRKRLPHQIPPMQEDSVITSTFSRVVS